ncbi:MAG: serine/threonine protein kinase, partial [Micromonosporaceae bacterium]
AALATHLEHPALVKVKEVFVGPPPHQAGQGAMQAGRRLYFVMKWIEGRSLQESLERGEIRGLDVLAPLEPIAEAIDYLHSGRDTNGNPVIHRDIKPANVLLAADGRVYLVDFGLVRLRATDNTSRIFGTAPFMAPESLARGEYTPATDRYTLGATVYYALTGEAPVPGDIEGMTQRLAAAVGPGRDREIRGIMTMLSARPDGRPPSAAGWLRALRSAPMETSVGGTPGLPPTTGPTSPGQFAQGSPGQFAQGPTSPGQFAQGPTSPGQFAQGSPGQFAQGPTSPGQFPQGPASPSGYPMPGTGTPGGLPPTTGPGSYPMPPGSSTGGPALGGAAAGGMPPVGGPQLSSAASGYLGAPQKRGKDTRGRTTLLVMAIVVLLIGTCCYAFWRSIPKYDGDGNAYGTPTATRSFDKSNPPPPVTKLRPVLVSVGDIASVMRTDRGSVSRSTDMDPLMGGLANLELCDESPVSGYAIGSTESNSYYATTDDYPYVSSAVAGFYSDEAKTYFKNTKEAAGRCGWSEMQTPKLGEQTLGVFVDDGTYGTVAIVFVRTGQVLMQLAVKCDECGSYQSYAIQLATAMAKRMPKGKA